MTVCIAALADSGKSVVMAVDRMVTFNMVGLAYEYETADALKLQRVAPNAVVLTSGNMQNASQVLRNVTQKLDGHPATIEAIAETVRQTYQEYRHQLIYERVLQPRGLTLASYYEFQQRLAASTLQEVEQSLSYFNLGVEFIVAGLTGEGCHIFSITNPGLLTCYDALGYVCVGSGGVHATYHLIERGYRKAATRTDTVSLVQDAKKRSEVAPGVGSDTETLALPELAE